MMDRTPLHHGWTLRSAGGPDAPGYAAATTTTIPAEVPGCVHTDLLAAGLVPDPYDGDNESALAWVGRHAWTYSSTLRALAAEPGERVDLVCTGLDTVADVSLDGRLLGHSENQFRTYRYDLRDALGALGTLDAHDALDGLDGADHALEVTFSSALDAVEAAVEHYGPLPHVNEHPYWGLRKMACNFGWDWGPDLVTAGIWRPIYLERWRTARLSSVRPLVTVDGTTGHVRAELTVEWADPAAPEAGLRASVRVGGDDGSISASVEVVAGAPGVTVELEVDDVELWWPRGYGSQPLYPLEVVLTDASGVVLDDERRRIGFRTVALDTTPDEHGIPMNIVVNGQTVLVRGANWIPDDAFVTRIDDARYRRRIDQAVDAECNLLRVWGGGIYEADAFYDVCDELGVLVWQDFLFACAAYPEEEPLRSEVEAEAREAVTSLSAHASLALWCGGNEDTVAYAEWHGVRARVGDRTWGEHYYEEMLPGIVAELDPTRPYLPNSPYSFGSYTSPNDQNNGDAHIWDAWNEKDWTAYADWRPRFASEWGFQGPPSWSALTRVVHDVPLRPDGPELLVHQKAEMGNEKLRRGLLPHLPVPSDFTDWHWATQLNQARAIAFGVTHFRSLAPLCTGTIIWQLNDCWPVVSWAVVDGDGTRKPAWHALRQAQADHLLTFREARGRWGDPVGSGLELVALDDHLAPWSGTVRLRAHDLSGAELAVVDVPLDVAPRTTQVIEVPAELLGGRLPWQDTRDAAPRIITATVDGARRATWWSHEDIDSALPQAELDTTVDRTPTGYDVTVTARTLAKEITLLVDRLDPAAEVDDALVTLLPGETAVFRISVDRDLDVDALVRRPVLRTANDLF